jgi:hypothetical protein
MKTLTALFLVTTILQAQQIKVTSGSIIHLENVPSKFVEHRNVDVWLPDGYSPAEKYAVLYMHDGQMLFDAAITWNKQSWEIDEVAGKLITDGTTKKFIVVGIWNNNEKRHAEYFPQKPYESLNAEQKEIVTKKLLEKGRTTAAFQPISNAYLQFLVTELKPYIDKNFATLSDKENTFIAGSSMGGLISMYAICEYPEVFGGAAGLSTHWVGIFESEDNPIPDAFYTYLKNNLPNPKNHKIYFDYGDQTLDALYPRLQKEVDKIMVEKGYSLKNWVTKFFPRKDHSEKSWAERIHVPLEFLLKE